MKKLLLIVILAALAYGGYKYMESVHRKTAERQDALKPSEKALREMDKDQ